MRALIGRREISEVKRHQKTSFTCLSHREPGEGRVGRKTATQRTALGSGLGHRDLDGPPFPADLLVAAHGQPGLAALLLEELDRDLAAAAARGVVLVRLGGIELAGQGGGALVDHGLELDIVDEREGQVQDLAGLRLHRGEEAMEEDGMQDAWKGLLVRYVPTQIRRYLDREIGT